MYKFDLFIFEGPLKLASPPGRSRMRAAPSPTPPSAHSNRHQSISDDDNAFEDKEEVHKSVIIFYSVLIKLLFHFQFINFDFCRFITSKNKTVLFRRRHENSLICNI